MIREVALIVGSCYPWERPPKDARDFQMARMCRGWSFDKHIIIPANAGHGWLQHRLAVIAVGWQRGRRDGLVHNRALIIKIPDPFALIVIRETAGPSITGI